MKSNNIWVGLTMVLLVVASCLVTYNFFPQTETKTVTVEKEVIKEVQVPTDPLAEAKALFWDEFSSDSDYWTCDNDEYRLKDIEVVDYNDYSVEEDGRDITTSFEVRLRFDEEDVRSCFDYLDVTVFEEHNEQPEVDIN